MCDTILAPPNSTADGVMLFGKNSDRQRNEAQTVEYFPRADHDRGSQISCTYITIPQVARTHATLLCRPFWIWGAEMGANERGVVIGNEGLTARGPAPEKEALVGMDLLRLALERGGTAAEAVEVITTLLERHGQGGNCGHLTPNYYNNGFLVADAKEAFVLETIGKEWLLEKVCHMHAISNVYSIRKPERVSGELRALISNSGWSTEEDPDYAAALKDPHKQHIGTGRVRQARGISLLSLHVGRQTALGMMGVLRDHGYPHHNSAEWTRECFIERTLCMHAGTSDRNAQTVGSMVSELSLGKAVHWVTGTSAPCTAIFKPILIDVPLPSVGARPTDQFNGRALWWRHERLHRMAVASGFSEFVSNIRNERDALEADFHSRVAAVLNGGTDADRARVIEECWREADRTEEQWYAQIAGKPPKEGAAHAAEWARMSRLAGIDFQ